MAREKSFSVNRIRETTLPTARVRTPSTRCCAPARMTHWNLFDDRARHRRNSDRLCIPIPLRFDATRRVHHAYPVTRELRRSPSSVIYSQLLIVSGICDDLTFYTSCVTIIMRKNWTKKFYENGGLRYKLNITNFIEREVLNIFRKELIFAMKRKKKKCTALLDW